MPVLKVQWVMGVSAVVLVCFWSGHALSDGWAPQTIAKHASELKPRNKAKIPPLFSPAADMQQHLGDAPNTPGNTHSNHTSISITHLFICSPLVKARAL